LTIGATNKGRKHYLAGVETGDMVPPYIEFKRLIITTKFLLAKAWTIAFGTASNSKSVAKILHVKDIQMRHLLLGTCKRKWGYVEQKKLQRTCRSWLFALALDLLVYCWRLRRGWTDKEAESKLGKGPQIIIMSFPCGRS